MLSGEMTVTVHDEEHSDTYKLLLNGRISHDTVRIRPADTKDKVRPSFFTGKLTRSVPIIYGGNQVVHRYNMYGTYDSVPGISGLDGGVWMVRPAPASDKMKRYD